MYGSAKRKLFKIHERDEDSTAATTATMAPTTAATTAKGKGKAKATTAAASRKRKAPATNNPPDAGHRADAEATSAKAKIKTAHLDAPVREDNAKDEEVDVKAGEGVIDAKHDGADGDAMMTDSSATEANTTTSADLAKKSAAKKKAPAKKDIATGATVAVAADDNGTTAGKCMSFFPHLAFLSSQSSIHH